MTIPTIFMYDATGPNEHVLPTNEMAAGYDTGPNVAWMTQQFQRHMLPYPAMHIDQDPNADDPLADWLDVEAGAATSDEILSWLWRARNDYITKARHGQRWPGLYCSENNVASLVAILTRASVVNVPFWVANYNISAAEAQLRVSTATGPYPAAGYQYTDQEFGGLADGSIMSLPHIIQTNEDEMISGQLTSQASVPFPAGSMSQLALFQDFVSPGSPTLVRVALHSLTQGYYHIIEPATLNEPWPLVINFTKVDTDDVSLTIQSQGIVGPVGYTIS